MSSALPWYALFLPFFAAVVIVVFTNHSPRLSSAISVLAVLLSFACSCGIFIASNASTTELRWIDLRPLLDIPFALTLDNLARTMLILVTGVGALIHIYSIGYMRD